MKIYLASGYTVMNVEGRERELYRKFKNWKRLISFYDLERGNKIQNILDLRKGKKDANYRNFSKYRRGN